MVTAAQFNDRIAIDPAVCHGRPVIKGTRVPVHVLVGAVGGGDSIEQVAADYGVAEADVRAAIGYAGSVLDEERHYPVRR